LTAVAVVIAAFYVFGQPVAQHGLLVKVGGSGSTNATGTQMYDAGALVAIQATADSGWVLSEWLLNDTSVGSANPYVVTMSENRNLTAIFTEEPVQGKVLLQTSMGNITIQLRDDMPITTANFKKLVQQGTYDGTIFHRVIADFMIQGGDPTGTGQGDPSIPAISDEFTSNNRNDRGTVAMANAGPNTGSSQFFINVVNNNYLDSKHPVFGTVIQGMDVVDAISKVTTDANDRPLEEVRIIKAELVP
jgi:peptidylprolyl isomerase